MLCTLGDCRHWSEEFYVSEIFKKDDLCHLVKICQNTWVHTGFLVRVRVARSLMVYVVFLKSLFVLFLFAMALFYVFLFTTPNCPFVFNSDYRCRNKGALMNDGLVLANQASADDDVIFMALKVNTIHAMLIYR